MFAFLSLLRYASVTCPMGGFFFSNFDVYARALPCFRKIFIEDRTQRFFVPFSNQNDKETSPSPTNQKWKLFSFEIVLRGRMVLCKIHAAIYTIAAAASAASASFWKMQ